MEGRDLTLPGDGDIRMWRGGYLMLPGDGDIGMGRGGDMMLPGDGDIKMGESDVALVIRQLKVCLRKPTIRKFLTVSEAGAQLHPHRLRQCT